MMKWIYIDENGRNMMETTETKKRADKPVQLTIAKLPGRRYEEDKPRDCRYCYYWAGRIRGCSRKECWYLLPLPEKPEPKFDANGVLIPDCKTCAYGKQGPCIGYCIAKIEREVFSKTRGWKAPADPSAEPAPDRDPGSIPASVCGVMT